MITPYKKRTFKKKIPFKSYSKLRRSKYLSKTNIPYNYLSTKRGEIKTIDNAYVDAAGTNALPDGVLAHCTYVLPAVWVNSATGQSGGYTVINGIVAGTGFNQRIGNKVTIKSIDVKLTLEATAGETCARVCLVLDRQVNGAAPLITAIFGDFSPLDVAVVPITAGILSTNRKRFKILKEQYTDVHSSHNTQTVRMFYKKPIPVDYSGATSTIGSIVTNAVYLIAMGTSSLFYNFVPQMHCRVRYYDN